MNECRPKKKRWIDVICDDCTHLETAIIDAALWTAHRTDATGDQNSKATKKQLTAALDV